jgi:hypothetical protein
MAKSVAKWAGNGQVGRSLHFLIMSAFVVIHAVIP